MVPAKLFFELILKLTGAFETYENARKAWGKLMRAICLKAVSGVFGVSQQD